MGLRLGSQVIPTVRLYKNGAKYPTGVIEINSETPAQCSVEITSSNADGNGVYSRIIYKGATYYATGDKFTVMSGDVINIWVESQRTDAAYLYLNGEQIAGGVSVSGQIAGYNYIIPNNTNIFIRINDGPTSYVYITEEELHEKIYDVSDYAFANVTNVPESVDYFTQYITDALVSYSNSNITSLPAYAFYGRNNLKEVDLPNCTYINSGAFQYCSALVSANFSVCTGISLDAFANCPKLLSANFPVCTSIGRNAFKECALLTSISFPNCTKIDTQAFQSCSSLTIADFPKCTSNGGQYTYTFSGCKSLSIANFPMLTSLGMFEFYDTALTTAYFPACVSMQQSAFGNCRSLITANFPVCSYIGWGAFYSCYSLTAASFPAGTQIYMNCFYDCYNLLSLYLLGSSLCSLNNINNFWSTPISNYTASTGGVHGSIYVPASLLASYQIATNWVTYSSRFVGV